LLGKLDQIAKLTAAGIEKLAGEWQALSEQGGVLRIWQSDAVCEVPEDYFDSFLLETLDHIQPPAGDQGFVRCARLIGKAIGRCQQDIGDAYFEHRVR